MARAKCRAGRRWTRTALGVALLAAAGPQACVAATDYLHVDGFEPRVDCSLAFTCPAQSAGKSCIAGQLVSADAGEPLRAFVDGALGCEGGAVGGPCNLQLTPHDAVSYFADPAGSPPLAYGTLERDACGRFRIQELTPPAFGTVALVVEDASALPEDDLHLPTATLLNVGASQGITSIEAPATSHHADGAWTATAGQPFGGSTFGDVGVVLFVFRSGDVPVAGVAVLQSGAVVASKDYYFADASPLQRQQVDPALVATGANGAALFIEAGVASYSGSGGEAGGCIWESVVASSVPGSVVFVPVDCSN